MHDSLLDDGDIKLVSPTSSAFSRNGVKLSSPPSPDQNFSAGVNVSDFLAEKIGVSSCVSWVMFIGFVFEVVLLVLRLTCDPELLIWSNGTLQSSFIVRLLLADEAEEQTVRGSVATVFLDDTDRDGVTRPKANPSSPFFLFLQEFKKRAWRFLF